MKNGLPVILLVLFLFACGNKEKPVVAPQENTEAKKMLQGIWIDEDTSDPFFRVEGDTVFYPDSTSMPVHFAIFTDTLVLNGSHIIRYPIIKQTPHIFQFKNENGEVMKLVKSDDSEDKDAFDVEHPIALNQRQTIKRDTIVISGNERYHCYVQVNPTTYKVYKPSYNDDGLQVDNIYYDNTIHVAVFKGNIRVYTHDFHKHDFSSLIPKDFLKQCILSDMLMTSSDANGIHYDAQLAIPDSPGSYIVDVAISYKGAMKMSISAE